MASFRFHLTVDALAFDYEIPVITALSGLVGFPTHLLGLLHARHTKYCHHAVAYPTGAEHPESAGRRASMLDEKSAFVEVHLIS